jgi:hypothetical protein
MVSVMTDIPAAPEKSVPAAAPQRVELRLPPSKGMRRVLNFEVTRSGSVFVGVYLPPLKGSSHSVMVAWATATSLNDCRLEIDQRSCLGVGRAAFDVTAEEARQIRERFAPLGLCIEEAKS